MSERRNKNRIVVGHLFSVFILQPNNDDPILTNSTDLSRTGISFKLPEGMALNEGNTLELRLYTYSSRTIYLRLKANVRWVRRGLVGVEFIISNPQQTLWIDRLCSFLEVAAFEGASDLDEK
tara:strand:- start:542 stop:907 length:366 start_codon:yes stop_codon:yes gene_type:complete